MKNFDSSSVDDFVDGVDGHAPIFIFDFEILKTGVYFFSVVWRHDNRQHLSENTSLDD